MDDIRAVYLFSEVCSDKNALLGEKGANLSDMTCLGLPVPKGFTITTKTCPRYCNDDKTINNETRQQISDYIDKLEKITGKKLGAVDSPLILSVRPSPCKPVPGLMNTVLYIGLNGEIVEKLAQKYDDARWIYDYYMRLIISFSVSAKEISERYFYQYIDEMKTLREVQYDSELNSEDFKELIKQFKSLYKSKTGEEFPTDPKTQLMETIDAAFRSWDNPRLKRLFKGSDLYSSFGLAVIIQEMVFGNMGEDCCTGSLFTRDPDSGEKCLTGEFLINKSDEDLISGTKTPYDLKAMKEVFPDVFGQLSEICSILENHYKDMQNIDFTVEHNKLFIIQTKKGKRTDKAAAKILCDLADEGLISEKEAVERINTMTVSSLLKPIFNKDALDAAVPSAKGLPLNHGAAVGKIVFSGAQAEISAEKGIDTTIVKPDLSLDDFSGVEKTAGVLISEGGMVSYAGVNCRAFDKPCISCSDITINAEEKWVKIGERLYREGDYLSIDGSTGCIYASIIPTHSEPTPEIERILSWAKQYGIEILEN